MTYTEYLAREFLQYPKTPMSVFAKWALDAYVEHGTGPRVRVTPAWLEDWMIAQDMPPRAYDYLDESVGRYFQTANGFAPDHPVWLPYRIAEAKKKRIARANRAALKRPEAPSSYTGPPRLRLVG